MGHGGPRVTGAAATVELIRLAPELDGALLDDRAYLAALREGRWSDAAARVHAVVGRSVPPSSTAVTGASWEWYFAGDTATKELVGSCAYKAAPDDDGVVEIAYFTYPQFEGRGYAKSMARRLLELARRSGAVRRVVAHTLPVESASTHVLTAVGMGWAGEVTDQEDGPVWRWHLELGDR